MSHLGIAIAQLPVVGATDPTTQAARLRAVRASAPQAEMIVCPELAITPPLQTSGDFFSVDQLALKGEELATVTKTHAALAQELGVWLLPGTAYERDADGRVFNVARVYSPSGTCEATYRKIAPWRPYETCASGNSFTVVDLPGKGRLGVLICYDMWFPELPRQLAWMGADALIIMTLTPTSDREQELALARAHAIANQAFVINVNGAAPGGIGRSIVFDPEGRTRTCAQGAEECVLTDVIDLAEAQRVRKQGTAGLNRLWHQFGASDDPVELPLYQSRIDPQRWAQAADKDRSTDR